MVKHEATRAQPTGMPTKDTSHAVWACSTKRPRGRRNSRAMPKTAIVENPTIEIQLGSSLVPNV